jgi:hypothetical protein
VTTWGYLVVLVGLMTASAAALRVWSGFPWFESAMAGLLLAVFVVAAIARRDYHAETWRDVRDFFGRGR